MSRRVSTERLDIIHAQVAGELRRASTNDNRRDFKNPVWVQVDARELSPLLDELRRRREGGKNKGRYAPGRTTETLMAMVVGETVDFPPITQGALTTARTTARKRMGVPDARWHAETQPDGYVKVTRLPDGAAQIYGKPRNPAVAQLAAMRVGEFTTVTTVRGHLTNAIKAQARTAMDYAGASWRATRLVNGTLKVERIA